MRHRRVCSLVQAWVLASGHAHWQTMVFTVLTLGQMAHVLAIRSETASVFRFGLLSNRHLLGAVALTFSLQMASIYVPFLNLPFETQPLTLEELMICLAAAAVVLFAVEVEKIWLRRKIKA